MAKAPSDLRPRFFFWSLLLLQVASLGLHFYGLSRFNTLVFDETSYARYGHNYFNHLPTFDAHPPLGKLLIGAGMWLADLWGYSTAEPTNLLSGAERAPWANRWVHALFGSDQWPGSDPLGPILPRAWSGCPD
ncbi:MAG: phospholipid carrier-dependent glycosyltransferase [Rhodoferax sp.]|nr:phospholipid carrier-dependent glycosyltransferase [Rhodoferax sp.]MCF8212166.1 phospholipid carrier-dependent glycosyltransferase [Rhodoferax sp.]